METGKRFYSIYDSIFKVYEFDAAINLSIKIAKRSIGLHMYHYVRKNGLISESMNTVIDGDFELNEVISINVENTRKNIIEGGLSWDK